MLLENHNAIESGGYQISNSLRFQSASSQSLSRTPASAGNRQTWTLSFWFKRGASLTDNYIYEGYTSDTLRDFIRFNNDSLVFSSNATVWRQTTQVFRDPSAWYHIIIVSDTTNATASNRLRIYVNGSEVTAFTTNTTVTQNTQWWINNNNLQVIMRSNFAGGFGYTDGYLSEVNFIDGQALTPSSFGQTDTLTGQWVAKKYTGTYGTNGFYLPFSNGTSTTTLGADSSGNSNNWTLNNFTRSAGVSDCWMFDVPSGNSGVSGTQPSSNYAVLQAPKGNSAGQSVITNANLKSTLGGTGSWRSIASTIAPVSGKWYTEFNLTNAPSSDGVMFGVSTLNANIFNVNAFYGGTADSWAMYTQSGQKWNSGSASAYGNSATTGDVIGIALDLDNGAIYYSKNGVWQNSGVPTSGASKTGAAFSLTTGSEYYIGYGAPSAQVVDANFGQRSFAYTPPSGFKALCTANLPAATIKQGNTVFDAKLWSGTGVARSITGYNFSPDFVWIKGRSTATFNLLSDTIRGINAQLSSNATNAEFTYTDQITAFNSDGFSLGVDASTGWCNYNDGRTYVGWAWDAGSSTVTNTNGSISSQVRANPTAGVSVITYTGTGANATVGHGLGVAPSMIIIRPRSDVDNWWVYHKNMGATLATQSMILNSTSALFTSTTGNIWGAHSSSVFVVGDRTGVNANGRPHIAYCFSEIAGYSRFGSYTGNGSTDGVFTYLGFRPKYLMVKASTSVGDGRWFIWDSVRETFNALGVQLQASDTSAEATYSATIDFLSNGFKLRSSYNGWNQSGSTYIYMAFAENPFAQANAR